MGLETLGQRRMLSRRHGRQQFGMRQDPTLPGIPDPHDLQGRRPHVHAEHIAQTRRLFFTFAALPDSHTLPHEAGKQDSCLLSAGRTFETGRPHVMDGFIPLTEVREQPLFAKRLVCSMPARHNAVPTGYRDPNIEGDLPMYTASDLRKGLKIEIDGDLYEVTEFQFVKPGK